jgi:two-component system alkaline phosphatase synthesis response regulator PhoP
MSSKRVLVVDDDDSVRETLSALLEQEGFAVGTAPDAEAGWRELVAPGADLVILDLILPGRSGLELLSEIRSHAATAGTPVLVLSARDTEMDKLLCFERGADDYLSKPFGVRELVARLRVMLRRSQVLADSDLDIGPLRVRSAAREATHHGRPLALTPREFELLRFLVQHPDRVLSRHELLRNVWGYDFSGDMRTVDVHVRRLRHKLGDRPSLIQTVVGAGYKLSRGRAMGSLTD